MSDGWGTKIGGDVEGSRAGESEKAQIAHNDEEARKNPKRFELNPDSDPVDLLVAIYIAAKKGRVLEAKAFFETMNLTVCQVQSWSEEKRARAAYFAQMLTRFKFHFSETISAAIYWPIRESAEADCWHYLRFTAIGMHTDIKPGVVNGMDGCSYIMRQLGMYKKNQPKLMRYFTLISKKYDPWEIVP